MSEEEILKYIKAKEFVRNSTDEKVIDNLIKMYERLQQENKLLCKQLDEQNDLANEYYKRISNARKYIEENCSADNRLNLKGILKPDFDFEKGNNAKNIKIPAIKDLKDYLEGDKVEITAKGKNM